jgi:hypothetical protein
MVLQTTINGMLMDCSIKTVLLVIQKAVLRRHWPWVKFDLRLSIDKGR